MCFSSEMEMHDYGTVNWFALLTVSLSSLNDLETPQQRKPLTCVFSSYFCQCSTSKDWKQHTLLHYLLAHAPLCLLHKQNANCKDLHIVNGKKKDFMVHVFQPPFRITTHWMQVKSPHCNQRLCVKKNCLVSAWDAPLTMHWQCLSVAGAWFGSLALSIKYSCT